MTASLSQFVPPIIQHALAVTPTAAVVFFWVRPSSYLSVVSTERTSRVCGSHKVVRRFRFAAESGRNSTRSVLSKGQKEGLFPITRLSFFVNDHHFWASSVECIHREYSELCEVLGSCCVR